MLPGDFPAPKYDGTLIQYEWLGAPHASESIKLINGVETARNLSVNPSYETSGTMGIIAGSAVNYGSRATQSERVISGDYCAYYTFSGGGSGNRATTFVQQETHVQPGQWVAFGVYGFSSVESRFFSGVITERANNGTTHVVHHIQEDYTELSQTNIANSRVIHVAQITDSSTDTVRFGVNFSSSGSSYNFPGTNGYMYLDGWVTAVADTEQEALDQVAIYFDGGTPDVVPTRIDTSDVVDLSTYTIVNGVRREIESVSLDRELSGDLPEQVIAAGGVAGSSGTIVWAPQADWMQAKEPSPWHKTFGWPPSGGDRVRVYVTDGTTSWPRFTGVIDRTTGDVGGSYQSTIIDDRDRMNRRMTSQAILRNQVPLYNGGEYRRMGLDFWYMLTRALRRAGIYNTPPLEGVTAMSAPMQGSVWPEAGTLSQANGTSGSHEYPIFYFASWGYAAGSAELEYLPAINDPITSTLQVSFMVGDDHSGDAHINVHYGAGNSQRVRLRVWPTRRVAAYFDNTIVVELTSAQMYGATIVNLLVKGSSWELQNNAGKHTSGTYARSGGGTMQRIAIGLDDDTRVAGVQVHRPSSVNEFAQLRFSPSMTFHRGFLASTMDMTPRMESRHVGDLVDEICKAALVSSWWDEAGVLRLVSADTLRTRNSVQTITSLDDITALSWEDSLLGVRSSVEVTWKDPIISRSRRFRQELFRNSRASLESGDEVEIFAAPDNRTEWFGVDRNPLRLNDSNWGSYNSGAGSYMGVYYTDGDGNKLPTSSNTTTIRVEPLGNVALKITHIAGSYGSGVEASLKTSEEGPALRQSHRGESLPVIRGRAKGEWVDEKYVSTITGPSYAPALTHDLGYWGHRRYGIYEGTSSASRIADYLAGMVATPHPTIRGVAVTYDPRRQLGDVVTLNVGILDVTLRALIVGISESHSKGHHEQELSVRIISANSSRQITYQELDELWDGGNYQGLQAVWEGLTYSDFENNAMNGEPDHG